MLGQEVVRLRRINTTWQASDGSKGLKSCTFCLFSVLVENTQAVSFD